MSEGANNNAPARNIQTALAGVRAEIDHIDSELLRLLNERARCAQKVGEIKAEFGDAGFIYRPEREAQVLRRLQDLNPGPLPGENITFFFREVMSACLSLEQPLGIAFLGRSVPFPNRRRPSISATPRVCCRRCRLTTSFAKSRPGMRITAWCRSKTRPKARSGERWTCCSGPR